MSVRGKDWLLGWLGRRVTGAVRLLLLFVVAGLIFRVVIGA